MGFAASARRLAARDAWVGWDDARRCAHLHRVVGLCRFLVRPGVRCHNFASHVLGRAARALREDFEALYGYRPWLLETFVDEREHTGASLRAANWVRVGESAGRGRNDRTHGAPETRKAVYLYELEPAWRERLGVSAPGLAPLTLGRGARRRELGGERVRRCSAGRCAPQRALGRERAPYGTVSDARHHRGDERSTRGGQGTLPTHRPARRQRGDGRTYPRAPSRAHAATHAIGVHGAVCPRHHQPELHPARPNPRAGGDWLEPDRCAGPRAAPAHHARGQSRRGASGVLRAGFDAPSPPTPKTPAPNRARRRSRFAGSRACATAPRALSTCPTRAWCAPWTARPTSATCSSSTAHTLRTSSCWCVRRSTASSAKNITAEGDRVVRRLFDEVRNAPARGSCTVEVSRQSARVKASKQPCKPKRRARLAETTLRYEPVALPCPQAAPLKLWMVHAREERPPRDAEALEWFLLTTVPVRSAEDAMRILQWYALRWRIEDYFRILKSGCKVEELQHHSAERLERAIAIKMVVGWRIQLMVDSGARSRSCPPRCCSPTSSCACSPPSLARAASLPPGTWARRSSGSLVFGGWLGRTRDPPGAQLLWHGYTQLAAMSLPSNCATNTDDINFMTSPARDVGHGQG